MSDPVINSGEFPPAQQQRDVSLAKRMALSREWEKAFLNKDEAMRQNKNNSGADAKTAMEEKPALQQPEKTNAVQGTEFDVQLERQLSKNSLPEQPQLGLAPIIVNGNGQYENMEIASPTQTGDVVLDISSKPVMRNTPELKTALPPHQNSVVQTGNTLSKTGLHVVSAEDGSVKVWFRDASVSGVAGLALLGSLRNVLSRMGVKLAAFTLNGKLVYEKQNAVNAESESEQGDSELTLYKSF